MSNNNSRDTTMNDLPFPDRPRLRRIDERFRPDFFKFSKRYTLAILSHIGFAITFAIRSNECIHKGSVENDVDRLYALFMTLWFLFAYFLVQIPAGIYSYKHSATHLFGICILGASITSFLTPITVGWHKAAIEYSAFLQGIFQGAASPAYFSMWRYWAPPLERSTLVTLGYAGTFSGVVIGYQLSVTFCSVFSWEKILYVYGLMGICWYLAWLWLVFEHPSQHPTIMDQEYVYLQQTVTIKQETPASPIPWKKIFTNLPICALFVSSFCRAWSLEDFQHSMYSQVKDHKEFGFLHIELYNLIMALSIPAAGFAADILLQKTSLSVTKLRKIYISGGLVINALFFIPALFNVQFTSAWYEISFWPVMVIYCISIAGFYANHLDIAAKYAGITMALANVIQTVAALLPTEFEIELFRFLENHRMSYILTIMTIFIGGGSFYYLYGSGEEQNLEDKPMEGENKEEETRGFENFASVNDWNPAEVLVE